jgi:hypothetical protein
MYCRLVHRYCLASGIRSEAMMMQSAGFYQMPKSYVPAYINCCIQRCENLKSNTHTRRLRPTVTSRKIRGKASWVHILSTVCRLYISDSSWNTNSKTLKPDWPQHDRSATCVTAQQYSYATFVSLCFHSHDFSVGLKNVILSLSLFFIYIFFYIFGSLITPCLKLR